MNILLFTLALVVPSQVNAACEKPPLLNEQLPANLAHAGESALEKDLDDLYLICPESGQWILKQTATGTLIPSTAEIKCIGDTWRTGSGITLSPEDQFACVEGQIDNEKMCNIKFSGMNQQILVGEHYTKCQLGQKTSITINGDPIDGTILKCVRAGTVSVDDKEHQYDTSAPSQQVVMDCVDEPTTTSTTTISTTTTVDPRSTTTTVDPRSTTTTVDPRSTTTTVDPRSTTTTVDPTTTTTAADTTPPSSAFLDLKYYYNYGRILHAFAADTTSYNAIMKNGIGYDKSKGLGSLGKTIGYSSDAFNDAQKACPTGIQSFKLLGFSRSGNAYVHNLKGEGLKMGYVSTKNGACGFKKPIKAWGCRKSADIMYAQNLESNTFYKGMVRHGGAVQFYLF